MEKQFVEIEVEVPKGYKAVKFDFAKKGDRYLGQDNLVKTWEYPYKNGVRVLHLIPLKGKP